LRHPIGAEASDAFPRTEANLSFRNVGKHRRAKLKDVLALKTRIDGQQAAMEALAEDAEDLRQRYGV
jgi:hypothetical protein